MSDAIDKKIATCHKMFLAGGYPDCREDAICEQHQDSLNILLGDELKEHLQAQPRPRSRRTRAIEPVPAPAKRDGDTESDGSFSNVYAIEQFRPRAANDCPRCRPDEMCDLHHDMAADTRIRQIAADNRPD